MKRQPHPDREIQAIAAKAMAEPQGLTAGKLCSSLRRMTYALRRHYTTANASAMRGPVDEWLCDNYYVLEKESKQSIKDIRQLAKAGDGGELTRLYHVFQRVLSSAMPPVNDDTVAAILAAMGEVHPLSERQFSFIPAAIKTVLVGMAFSAVTDTGRVEEISYAIIGLSKLSAVDFQTIIQQCSGVEQILLEDPAGVYARMSSESRQYYRYLVARIAASRRCAEQQVAGEMLVEARRAEAGGGDAFQNAAAHVGYGILNHRQIRGARRARGRLAVTLGVVLPLILAGLLAVWAGSPAVLVLTYLPLWEILRTLIHQLALTGVDVDFIPRMDPTKTEERPKTVVLVSTLLPKAAEGPALARRLEQLYFSNSDPDMYYCILADFKEWDFPTDEKDESQVAAARKVIADLNRRHRNRFMLFLRGRTYNKTQGRYSGWERKRGAITEFVRFLKGEKTSVHTFVGDGAVLPEIRYIIALDSDTSLLYESAQTLVAVAMHPLNRPVISPEGVVVGGYGILTPKLSCDLQSAKVTAFSRVLSGCGGVTAYDTKDKDFYQDLFGEGIFAGKGLIDVDCFHRLLSDRFPENRVLSHDILEGAYLRCGFVSDAEMTDTAPTSMTGWLARLHRWLRGDWQNIVFTGARYRAEGRVYENPIGNLSKYKLFDNLRRSLTSVAALFCVVAALAAPPEQAVVLGLCGVLAVTFAPLWAAAWALINGGLFTLSRKFFTRTLPHTFELIAQALFLLIMLPAQAFLTIDAVVRSLWRTFVSHKKLLEWTTAAQSDSRQAGIWSVLRRYWAAELFGILYLLVSSHSALCLLGLVFALVIPVAHYSAKPTAEGGHRLSGADRDTLVSYNAAMWRYYEEFATAENHFLPPDNIQQSPVYRVAARTSPTNIGMMLLSVLAARDFDFIDTAGLYLRVERTIATVEGLKMWRGNLINWYDTTTLETLQPEFVSTVDSGNFICCLVALKEGLREFVAELPAFGELIRRIETLIENTDLAEFYDERKHLFSIGYDVPSGKMVDSHYDFLMSEARLTSYYAVARKTVGKKHWGALNRTMSRWGSFAGPVSWTGTMFEYFMPHLLLPVYDGSLLGESLAYCLYCHKRRARAAGVPWGISESAFYAFDNNLNYQYKAHGVQKVGVKRYLDKELVISPYSTFLTIPMNPNSSMGNLARLRELGVYGRYGFFEAVDFTAKRVGTLAVTRSYMAHHIGMSMVASANAVFDGRMQRRFMSDNYMKSAGEFLQEKIAKNTLIYDDLKNGEAREEKQERPRIREESRNASPLAPQCVLLTNGEITDILTDTGAGYLKFGGIDLTRRETDLLRRAQGILTLVRMDGVTLPSAPAPFYDPDAEYTLEQQEQSVTYFAKKKDVEVGVRCLIHPTISCQQRQIVVKNKSPGKQIAQILVYFEPVLSAYNDYSAHPAYSKLFVSAGYDAGTKTLTFCRRNRDSTSDMFLTVGFLQDIDFNFETRREELMSAPNGVEELLQFHERTFIQGGAGTPDACCALRFDLLVAAGSQQQATLLLSAAPSAAEGIQNIITMRKLGVLEPKHAAKSPLLSDSLEARLGAGALGQLLFTTADCTENKVDKRSNPLGQTALWATGISGDLPIALVETAGAADTVTLESYLRLHSSLRSLQVEFDLCVLYSDDHSREELLELVEKNSVTTIVGARGGVFLLQKSTLAPELLTLLRAVARHTAVKGMPGEKSPAIPYRPVELRQVSPAPMPTKPELAVEGGAFLQGRFYVDKTSPLPWCHVLANSQFGTLVSDNALGFTWAVNSRENKLTPWYNDIATDNTGELLVLHDGDSYFSLTHGARASFSSADARYEGKTSRIEAAVVVAVGAGCAKYIDVTLHNRGDKPRQIECAYYTEPVLGVTRDTARHIQSETAGDMLLQHNPYNTAVQSWSALTGSGGKARQMVDRGAFLSGDWQSCAVEPHNDPCGAVILAAKLAPGGEAKFRFVLAWGKTRDSAAFAAAQPMAEPLHRPAAIVIDTPDAHLNQFINHFALHQMHASRIMGRCAFYQCGGAFGFRDQLQDCSAYLLVDPGVAKRQILRCCGVQFEEGDVLHWWHDLPGSGGGLKGVRTRFSDDLLWLPLVVADYVEKTGDRGILDLEVRYLSAPQLGPREQEQYISPQRSGLRETVFAHCVRALNRGYNLGENGLPLIGCGDWNDGFSSVGREGRGTSVWLALFLSRVLTRFSAICTLRGDGTLAQDCLDRAAGLRETVDRLCWDGQWYIRAFFDSGEKMGSQESPECRIDLLPQSFAVFAGMPDRERVAQGLQSALDHLVDWRLRLVHLFDPPFQHAPQQPGYVKAYPSGIRENGGQYTHSAVWFAMALLESGRVEEGWQILAMLNPVDRASHSELAGQYRLEPYYMAADISTNPDAEGRGGWSMYTGAVSWYYRAVIEVLLGVRYHGDTITVEPHLPAEWPRANLRLRLRNTDVSIEIRRGAERGLHCDGRPAQAIPLDGGSHRVVVGIPVSEA